MNAKIAHNLEEKQRTNDIKIDENVTFDEMYLSDSVLKGLHSCGYIRPSPIQLSAIPLGRCGLDLIIQAKSGTGKTCVFTVVALEMISVKAMTTQVLVVAPTREIAVQIGQVINSVGSFFPELKAYTFIGGINIMDDKAKLSCCHIAIGTPGRLNHLVASEHLNLSNIRLLVLDEADQLLMGQFKSSILELIKTSPLNKQILACSATYPKGVTDFLDQFMRSPSHVRLGKESPALIGVRQFVRLLPDHPQSFTKHKFKFQELLSVLSLISFNQCLVFSNSQLRAESVCNQLKSAGWPVAFLTGGQVQKDRLQSFFDLCSYKCRILVSTDLSARGLDSEHVNLVINMDIPIDQATYLHRIGRAGRFGSTGVAISLACEGDEWEAMRAIVNRTNVVIKTLPEKFNSDIVQNDGEDLESVRPLDEENFTSFIEKVNERKLKSQVKNKTEQKDILLENSKKYVIEKENRRKQKSQKEKVEQLDLKSKNTEEVSKKDQFNMKTFHSILNDYKIDKKFISFSNNNIINQISEDRKNLVKGDIKEFSPSNFVKEYPTKSMFDVLDKYIANREKNNLIKSSSAQLKNDSFDKIEVLQKIIDSDRPVQELKHIDNNVSEPSISSQAEIGEEAASVCNEVNRNAQESTDSSSLSQKSTSASDVNNTVETRNKTTLREKKLDQNIDIDQEASLNEVKVLKSRKKIYNEKTGFGAWEPVETQTKNDSEHSYFYRASKEHVDRHIDYSNESNNWYQNTDINNYSDNMYGNLYSSNPSIDFYVQSAQKFALMMDYTRNLGRMSAWIAQDNENKLIEKQSRKSTN